MAKSLSTYIFVPAETDSRLPCKALTVKITPPASSHQISITFMWMCPLAAGWALSILNLGMLADVIGAETGMCDWPPCLALLISP